MIDAFKLCIVLQNSTVVTNSISECIKIIKILTLQPRGRGLTHGAVSRLPDPTALQGSSTARKSILTAQMEKDKYKDPKGTGGSHQGGDLGHFFTRSLAAAQRQPGSKMVPESPAGSESALDSLSLTQTLHPPPGDPDQSDDQMIQEPF